MNPVPLLDLAPKRARPLSPWNPLDYVVLAWWAFFFPQAFRWYLERFAGYRLLVVQSLLAIPLLTAGAVYGLEACGISVSWAGVVFGIVAGIFVGAVIGLAVGLDAGVPEGIMVGVAVGLSVGITGGIGFGLVDPSGGDVDFHLAGGLVVGLVLGFAVTVAAHVAGGVAVGAAGGLVIGLIGGVVLSLTEGWLFGCSYAVSSLFVIARFPDWLLVSSLNLVWPRRFWSRVTWLPLPRVAGKTSRWLEADWPAGVRNVNQILEFTLQFPPVVRSVDRVLGRSLPEELLPRVAVLADDPYDWELLRLGSVSMTDRFLESLIEGLVWLPLQWRMSLKERYSSGLRLDTPARSACAGFWWWHSGDSARAEEAFREVGEVRFGPELYGIARAMVAAGRVTGLATLADWRREADGLDDLSAETLRPRSLEILKVLRVVSEEASTAYRAASPLNRSLALARASAELNRVATATEPLCPEPEWSLLRKIAAAWLQIVVAAIGATGEDIEREPVLNPYEGYSGLPVTGHSFTGRRDVFETIETLWASMETQPAVFLYGHRRMGKTSILRNLEHAAPRGTLLVYLDMHDSASLDGTGELLLDLAEGVHRRALEAGLDVGPAPDEIRYERSARRELNALMNRLDPQMEGRRLVLAIDEFEKIEQAIAKDRVDAGVLDYFRALNQRHRWLALVFAGLHTLGEMGRDYRSAFFGQAEHVRVSYLSREEAERLITQPHPDFALEHAPELRDELYRLTFGQPFLLQRICWDMVNRWNKRFLAGGDKSARTLTLADLEPVLDHDLYEGAAYYFDGVWKNVTEEERRTLATLAGREGHWAAPDLGAALGATIEEAGESLALLKRHDVIVEEAGGIRFASELMRRWVVRSGFAR